MSGDENTEDVRDEDELEPEAELVALRLADGASHAEAAMVIARSAKWVQRRLADDSRFRQRVLDLKSARVEQASAGLGALLEEALRVVARNLQAEHPTDQLQAARLVLDRSRLFRADAEVVEELTFMRGQLAELRAAIEHGTNPTRSDR